MSRPPKTPTNIAAFASDLQAASIAVLLDVAPYTIDGLTPAAVARPKTIEDLSAVMRSATRHRLAVTPMGGRTRLAIGNVPRRLDAGIDMTGLTRIIAHNHADLTATVEAGVTVAALQEALARHGQLLAIDPPLPGRATVGGTLAIGTAGPLKWQYLNPRDFVIGMKVVQADGTVTKSGGQVVKNVSGYDMSRLHIGGLGTLGIIAEVSFKLTPLPAKEATVIASFRDIGAASQAALAIFRSHVLPLAITCFNSGAGDKISVEATPVRQASATLAIRLSGRQLTIERQLRECADTARAAGSNSIETLDEPTASALWRSLADFGWDRHTPPALGIRASVLPSQVAEVVAEASAAAPAPGVVTQPAHGTVLMIWTDGVRESELRPIVDRLRQATQRLGGTSVVEQCPLALKSSLDVWGDVGAPIETMRRLKEQFDHVGTINPGRFVGGI